MMIDVYLACPYSANYLAIKTQRTHAADVAASKLMNAGLLTFSPISHSHGIAIHGGLPGDWNYWKEFDEEFVAFARVIVVLTIPGYETSIGVDAEVKMAEDFGHPVIFWNGDDDEKFFDELRATIDEIKKRELEEFESQLSDMENQLDEQIGADESGD